MKTTFATLTFALLMSGSAFGNTCRPPVGGSENSVGEGPVQGLPAAAFNQSAEVAGQRDLLTRRGFCAQTRRPWIEVISDSCDNGSNFCQATYSITMAYSHVDLGTRTVSAQFTWSSDRRGSGEIYVEALDVDGIGHEVELSGEQSDLLFDAMRTSGITNPSRVVGYASLAAGRLQCSRVVFPNANARCWFTDGSTRRNVVGTDVANAIEAILIDLDAFERPIRMGAVNTSVSLVKCGRGVFPNAVAECTVVVED